MHISLMEGSQELPRACARPYVLPAKSLYLAAKDVGKYWLYLTWPAKKFSYVFQNKEMLGEN